MLVPPSTTPNISSRPMPLCRRCGVSLERDADICVHCSNALLNCSICNDRTVNLKAGDEWRCDRCKAEYRDRSWRDVVGSFWYRINFQVDNNQLDSDLKFKDEGYKSWYGRIKEFRANIEAEAAAERAKELVLMRARRARQMRDEEAISAVKKQGRNARAMLGMFGNIGGPTKRSVYTQPKHQRTEPTGFFTMARRLARKPPPKQPEIEVDDAYVYKPAAATGLYMDSRTSRRLATQGPRRMPQFNHSNTVIRKRAFKATHAAADKRRIADEKRIARAEVQTNKRTKARKTRKTRKRKTRKRKTPDSDSGSDYDSDTMAADTIERHAEPPAKRPKFSDADDSEEEFIPSKRT